MPKNVEIKARLQHADETARLAAMIADGKAIVLRQVDTFFAGAKGRLKLRQFDDGRTELIAYQRDNKAGPKTSDYIVTPVNAPELLKASLIRAYGLQATVCKTRRLLMAGRTRIHLDEVESLGSFLELEVVLAEGEDEEKGQAEALALMQKLGVPREALISSAYVDMLAQPQSRDRKGLWMVVFGSQRRADDEAGYLSTVQQMESLVTKQEGYRGHESCRGPDGFGLTVSYWRDRDSVQRWRRVAEHAEAQRRGQTTWYSSYYLYGGPIIEGIERQERT